MVPGKGVRLLGLPDIVLIDLPSVNCCTIDTSPRIKQINAKQTEAGCNTNTKLIINSAIRLTKRRKIG